jgi:hypothetical protein
VLPSRSSPLRRKRRGLKRNESKRLSKGGKIVLIMFSTS